MKKLKIFLSSILSLVMVFSIFACGDTKAPNDIYALNKNVISIKEGETFTLELTKNGLTIGDSSNITWTSSKPDVATVINGVVKAKNAGSCSVTAKYNDQTISCNVTVTPLPVIALNSESIIVGIDEYKILKLTQDGEMIQGVQWSSLDNNICCVNNGIVTGVATGETTVIASLNNKTYPCRVIVTPAFKPIGNFYSSMKVEEMEGKPTFEFDLVLNEDKTFIYSRRNNEIAQIEGEVLIEGTYVYDNGCLALNYGDNESILFNTLSQDKIISAKKIITGGQDVILTFERV